MLSHCVAVVVGLLSVSLLSKLLFEHPGKSTEDQIQTLVQEALHWRDVAASEVADPPLHLTYLVTASTYLQATRTLADDVSIERAVGLDVAKLNDALERDAARVRQSVAAGGKATVRGHDHPRG